MRPARAATFAALLLLLTGCGTEAGTSPTTTTSAASAGKCSDVVREGQTVTDALIDTGCLDDKGTKRLGKVTVCKDGRRLWEMDKMIGMSGSRMVLESAAANDGITARVLNELACKS